LETAELIRKVRRIELRTRGLSNRIFSGEYHSAFKGQGMAFRENRAYQPGDSIRSIDWNVTARMNSPFIKVFEEERELTAMLLVDVSASGAMGSRGGTVRQMAAELSAVLAFSAMQNGDKVGALLFSDRVEKFIPPKKGRSHVLRIIRELLEFTPEGQGTDLNLALEHFARAMKKRTISFLISDFQDENFEKTLQRVARKHDLVALQMTAPFDREAVETGWAMTRDPETGEQGFVRTGGKRWKARFESAIAEHQSSLEEHFKRCGVDHARLWTDRPYVEPLMQLFDRRGK
jgi:uncharacterized protein (DUF58 family)